LATVLLLQVVSAGGVASADPLTGYEKLNQVRNQNEDIDDAINKVQDMLQDGSLIDITDQTTLYDPLDAEQKKELARGMIL
ncbi:hypothetical protein, partial [Bacillus nitratireducens]